MTWEHPPTTLAACAAVWLASLVARVWMIPLLPSLCALWLAGFTLPPLAQALGPTAGVALRHAAGGAVQRFAHVLNDRRLQLGAVGGVWVCTGYAGRTLLVLAVGPARHCRQVIQRILKPLILSYIASYDVASNMYQAHYPLHVTTHFGTSFLKLHGILPRGEQYLPGPTWRW